MKLASWNVNSLKVRLPQVLEWLEHHQPDLLALQETKLPDDRFPADAFAECGWRACYAGQATYNGVALLGRETVTDVITDLPGTSDPQRRILGATIGDLRVYNVYVPNGQAVGSEKYAYKLDWIERLTRHLEDELSHHNRLVVMGDFNVAPTDADVHDPEAWAGQIHCSNAERAALRRLMDLGLQDTFRLFDQPPDTWSWWDYRAAAFRRNRGLRIDLILASRLLASDCRASTVDIEPRRAERPSDHAPVIADFAHHRGARA